jgi:hypothetical protein
MACGAISESFPTVDREGPGRAAPMRSASWACHAFRKNSNKRRPVRQENVGFFADGRGPGLPLSIAGLRSRLGW